MFNRLRLVDAGRDIGRVGQCCVSIPALDLHMGKHIAPRVNLWTVRLQRGMAINHRRQHFIVDDNGFDGLAGKRFALGYHPGQYIADVVGYFACADHQRPILFDQANCFVAGHIFGGEDPDHAGHGGRGAGINLQHVGAGMIAKFERAIEHALQLHIGDIGALTQHYPFGIIARVAGANFAVAGGLPNLFFGADGVGGIEDGVNDLLVASTTTEVGGERFGHLVAAGIGVLVEQHFGLHHDAGDAEATLHPTFFDKGVGKGLLIVVTHPLGGDDTAARHLLHRRDTGEHCLVIDLDCTAATGRLRCAAILGRGDALLVA